jgi:hypothetical protein
LDNFGKQLKAMETKLASLETKLLEALKENKDLKADIKVKEKIFEDLHAGYSTPVSRCNNP